MRHTTTSQDGRRTYRGKPNICRNCPCRQACGAKENGQRTLTTHIWQGFLDLAEQLRLADGGEVYSMRKKTIERVFADAKEKHGLRYTHLRGLTRVSTWVRLMFAAMNLKKLALRCWGEPLLSAFFAIFYPPIAFPPLSSFL